MSAGTSSGSGAAWAGSSRRFSTFSESFFADVSRETLRAVLEGLDRVKAFFLDALALESEFSFAAELRRDVPFAADYFDGDFFVRFEGARSVAAMSSDVRWPPPA